LIHSLTVYKGKEQKYGREYFYNLNTIKSYFKLNYLSSGYIENNDNYINTFFLQLINKLKTLQERYINLTNVFTTIRNYE
jgi:hypothetical protein